MRIQLKSKALCLGAALLLSACGAQTAKVSNTAVDGSEGIACNVGKTTSTRLSFELQQCLVAEAMGDFLSRSMSGTEEWVVMLDGRNIENNTDQTTVDAQGLADFIGRELGVKARIKTTTDFYAASHTLTVNIRGQRVREAGGAQAVTYTLRFNINDLVGNVKASGYGDIKVQRGKRPFL